MTSFHTFQKRAWLRISSHWRSLLMPRPTGECYPGPLVNAIQVLQQATAGWHAGVSTTIIDKRVVSKKSGRTTDSSWEFLEEEEKQEWSQNGALGYTRWDRPGFLWPITTLRRSSCGSSSAFKPIKLFPVLTPECAQQQALIYPIKRLRDIKEAGMYFLSFVESRVNVFQERKKLPNSWPFRQKPKLLVRNNTGL